MNRGGFPAKPMREKLMEFVREDRGFTSPCWIWQLQLSPGGYGRVAVSRRWLSAHRQSFIQAKGAIPDGLHIDHLCRVVCCINPDHLEAVTPFENVRRQVAARTSEQKTARAFCKNGHPRVPENLSVDPHAYAVCKTCKRASFAARRGKPPTNKRSPALTKATQHEILKLRLQDPEHNTFRVLGRMFGVDASTVVRAVKVASADLAIAA